MEKAFKIVRKGACMIVCYCFEEGSGLKVEKSDDSVGKFSFKRNFMHIVTHTLNS